MNAVHPLGLPPKLFTSRQRFSVNEIRPVSLVKLERGFAQRSLLYCLGKGCFSLIHYLLQTGATNARERDSEGRTALMYCCFIDNDAWAQNLARILLEYGSKIGDEDHRGLNALHYAIITQRLSLVRLYLSSLDFNLNQAIDIHGNTCLHYAVSTGNTEIVRLVLDAMKRYAIDLSIRNRYGLTAHDIACQLNHESCQNLLQNKLTVSENDQPSSATPTKTHTLPFIAETTGNRRSSIGVQTPGTASNRARATTPSTPGAASVYMTPFSVASAKSLRKPLSTASFSSESSVYPSSIFINPIESCNVKLRRRKVLDLSLVNQARSQSRLGSSTSISPSNSFSNSSSTWRNDFLKVFDRFQMLRTPSYRETVHPPLSNELPTDLYQNLYTNGDTFRYDNNGFQSSGLAGINPSQKPDNRRRGSALSAKLIQRVKK